MCVLEVCGWIACFLDFRLPALRPSALCPAAKCNAGPKLIRMVLERMGMEESNQQRVNLFYLIDSILQVGEAGWLNAWRLLQHDETRGCLRVVAAMGHAFVKKV